MAHNKVESHRKIYIRDVYSKYWFTAREKIYGFSEYDKNLCRYICEQVSSEAKLLDVACGTGYPFADYFQKAGYSVHGIDISLNLIEKCRQLNPNIDCKVGDAEALDYSDGYFDGTYCFHSTWYFPNLEKVIDGMLRVTRLGGLVIFDIQNRNNEEVDSAYCVKVLNSVGISRAIRYAKEFATFIVLQNMMPIWNVPIYEIPIYPEVIYEHLKGEDFGVMAKKEDDSLETMDGYYPFEKFGRLVFVIRK